MSTASNRAAFEEVKACFERIIKCSLEPDKVYIHATRGLQALLRYPDEPEAGGWRGEYICSVCHKEFGRPLGIAMIFYRSEHYLLDGRQCAGTLIPHERRVHPSSPVQDAAPLREACQAALDWRGLDGDGISDPVRLQLIAALVAPADGLGERVRDNYNDLLMAVERKFPDETRHQTALRYIKEAESRSLSGSPADALLAEIGGKP